MNLVAAVVSLPVAVLLGLLLLGWTCSAPPFRHAAGNLALAHMVGCGALTILLVLTQIITGRLMLFPVYLCLLVLLAGWKRVAKSTRLLLTSRPAALEAPAAGKRPIARTLLLVFIPICAVITIAAGLKSGLGWDAWTFWQLKARAFTIDGNMSYLTDTAHCFHPDYPPMIPLLSYWVFAHARTTAEVWPEIIGMMFYIDLLLIAYASFRLWIAPTPSLACVALIASSRVVQKFALAGYADVAAAAYMLAVAVFLVRRFVDKDRSAGVPLMWMLASASLVKNESLAWTLAAVLVIAGFGVLQRAKVAVACIAAFAAGYLPWFWLQRTWNLRNDVTAKVTGSLPTSVALSSLADILAHFVKYSVMVGPQYPAWGLFTMLVIAGVALAARRRNRHVVPLILMLIMQFVSYIYILIWALWIEPGWYVIYMNDTIHRCLLQVFPTAMLLAGLGCFWTKSETAVAGTVEPRDCPVVTI